MRKAADSARHSLTEISCKQCPPGTWVRRMDLENHRSNYHRAGGYMFERRKKAAADAKAAEQTAEKARRDAEKAERQAAARAARPTNTSKKENTMAGDKKDWWAPTNSTGAAPAAAARNGNGQAQRSAPAAMSATEGVAQLIWTWARQVPPSIPASRADAQASAEMWRQAADAVRARARAEGEANRIPPDLLEPYLQVAQLLSQLGDLHMEVVKRMVQRYGQVAETLADPRTPSAEFLKGGV
jgi:hypothetical protein